MKEGMVFVCLLLLLGSAPAVTYNLTNAGYYPTADFEVKNLVQMPDRVYPGDQVRLQFTVENKRAGGSISAQLTALVPFLGDKLTYLLGSMAQGASKSVNVDFEVPTGTKPGSYEIFLFVVDDMRSQTQVGGIPLVINEPQQGSVLVAKINPVGDAFAGDSRKIAVEMENYGSLAATDVVVQMQYSTSNSIWPIENDRMYIASIPANGRAEVEFDIGISASATPAYYPVTLVINYKMDKLGQTAITQTASLKVLAKTNLLITSAGATASSDSTGGSTLAITIANTGDTAVRSVYAIASSDDFSISGIPDQFIGTLNQDDSSSMSVAITPKRTGMPANPSAAPGTGFQQGTPTGGKVNIKVTYKDAMNIEHTQIQSIQVSAGAASSAGTTGVGSTQRFGRQQQGFRIFGIDWWMIAGAIVLLVGAFFGYKWMKRKEHKNEIIVKGR